ncbi:MAG: ATP synthase F0 subunit C [Ruminococcaceae bacterium]|jgi:F-type H+-transporting ATPase subunit c|nr:ATP synthase F0 subunit C [Oscillospiraceae bacterium]
MNRKKSFVLSLLVLLALTVVLPAAAFAADGAAVSPETAQIEAEAETVSGKSFGSGLAIGIAAAGGAIGMGIAVGKAAESISRQPESSGEIRSAMMLGLVFIETAIIYALLVVILIIFVL